jgi:hypothetical protein
MRITDELEGEIVLRRDSALTGGMRGGGTDKNGNGQKKESSMRFSHGARTVAHKKNAVQDEGAMQPRDG